LNKRSKGTAPSLNDLPTPLTVEQSAELWQHLLHNIVTDRWNDVCDTAAKMLLGDFIVQNVTEETTEEDWQILRQTKLIIPEEVVALRREQQFMKCDNGGLLGVTKLGFADYMRVEQELCCYVPGEVSHIENIMAKEYKERSTRNLTRSETSYEYANETEMENISDTTTTTRHDLHNEVAEVLTEQTNFNANVSGSVSYSPPPETGTPSYSINAYAGVDTSSSSSLSTTTAETFAEETTKRALERVVRKVSEKRTSKILREFEENQKHGFDNTKSDFHITGVYRWVDKIYTNRLINYGRRLILEFSVPEPARWYREAMLRKPKKDSENAPTAPEKPMTLAEKGVNSPSDIVRSDAPIGVGKDYAALAAYYGVTIAAPKPENYTKSTSFDDVRPVNPSGDETNQTHTITGTDPDYEVKEIRLNYSGTHVTWDAGHFWIDILGTRLVNQFLAWNSVGFDNGNNNPVRTF
jgi:hypothetical protein